MVDGEPFLFQNPLTNTSALLCLARKTGSTTWKLAILRAARREIGPPYDVFDESPHAATIPLDATLVAREPPLAFLVVRNPYSRFLSAYLDKVVHDYDTSTVNVTTDHWAPRVNASAKTFGDFVRAFSHAHAQDHLLRFNGVSALEKHFRPLSKTCDLDKDLPREYHHILRVEQMAEWYDFFVRSLGLEAVVKVGWDSSGTWFRGTGTPCFYSPPGVDCNGRPVPNGTGTAPASYHSTSADARLGDFYAPQAACLVTVLFSEDLARFGYPTWDGRDGAAYLKSIRDAPTGLPAPGQPPDPGAGSGSSLSRSPETGPRTGLGAAACLGIALGPQ